MAVTAKHLAHGVAGTSLSTMYVTPSATQTIISSAFFHNTDSSSCTIDLFVEISSTDYQIWHQTIAANGTFVLNERFILEATHEFKIQASTISVIHYLISGAEIT